MDKMVFKIQQWLNSTYNGKSGYNAITEDGNTGWNTIGADGAKKLSNTLAKLGNTEYSFEVSCTDDSLEISI